MKRSSELQRIETCARPHLVGADGVAQSSSSALPSLHGWLNSFLRPLQRMSIPTLLCCLLLSFLCSCASPKPNGDPQRKFDFQTDSFAFANELTWEYGFDEHGHWTSHARKPKPQYTLHCFVLARSAAQFFKFARFDPRQPVADDATYCRLIKKVVSANLRKDSHKSPQVIIPGYPNLRAFSKAQENLLKQECGSASQSYYQRGNWRMIFPFSSSGQQHMAEQLRGAVQEQGVAVVHISRFPKLTINHSIVLFNEQDSADHLVFSAYDPNNPVEPTVLTFDRKTRTFLFPRTAYFEGGRVEAYQLCHKWDY